MKPASLLMLLIAIPVAADALEPRLREGFGSSYGPALVGGPIRCPTCGNDGFVGLGGYLRLGRYIRPDLLVGVEADLHTLPLNYSREDANFFSATAQWYPSVDKGFYVKGSLGVARIVKVDDEDDTTQKVALTGAALGISLGYDISTRRGFLLTPFASVTSIPSANYKENRNATLSASGAAFQIGLGFTWY